MLGREELHFSFAGLKTAVRRSAERLAPLRDQDVADLAAGFEAAVTESVVDRCARAMDAAADTLGRAGARHFVVAGGVAANDRLRAALRDLAVRKGYDFHVPPVELCSDNAAMIAWAGAERLAAGLIDPLDAPVRPRWPLDLAARPAIGAGVKA
jgi:N6-L-threonylcarbamoyladenine synthase